jgi:hypothetical protein
MMVLSLKNLSFSRLSIGGIQRMRYIHVHHITTIKNPINTAISFFHGNFFFGVRDMCLSLFLLNEMSLSAERIVVLCYKD